MLSSIANNTPGLLIMNIRNKKEVMPEVTQSNYLKRLFLYRRISKKEDRC